MIALVCLWPSAGYPQQAGIDLSDWDWSSAGDEVAEPEPASPAEPVRSPKPRAAPDPAAEPRPAIALFPGPPPFLVVPGVKDEAMYPCGNCHLWAESDPTPRVLKEPHDNLVFRHGLHGKGRLWCFTCHQTGDDGLRTLEGEPVGSDNAYLICAQCHANQARDWAFGAHGKRVGGWRSERRVLDCTACHSPHRPAWETRDARPGPVIRRGLERPAHRAPRGGTELAPRGLPSRADD